MDLGISQARLNTSFGNRTPGKVTAGGTDSNTNDADFTSDDADTCDSQTSAAYSDALAATLSLDPNSTGEGGGHRILSFKEKVRRLSLL